MEEGDLWVKKLERVFNLEISGIEDYKECDPAVGCVQYISMAIAMDENVICWLFSVNSYSPICKHRVSEAYWHFLGMCSW